MGEVYISRGDIGRPGTVDPLIAPTDAEIEAVVATDDNPAEELDIAPPEEATVVEPADE